MTAPAVYDFAVLGCGSMGSSVLYQLAKRHGATGQKIIGIEKYPIDETYGSAGGLSRIIRKAYFESPEYVRLLNRSYDLYAELEEDIESSNLTFPSTLQCTDGSKVLTICGGVDLGPPGSEMVLGAAEACRLNGLPYDMLTSAQLTQRFPGFVAPEDYIAVYQKDGGILEPMKVNFAYNTLAKEKYGADLLTSTTITNVSYNEVTDTFTINTSPTHMNCDQQSQSSLITARKIVICTGPWIKTHYTTWDIFEPIQNPETKEQNQLYQKIDYLFDNARMQVQRQVVNWHSINPDAIASKLYHCDNFPIFLIHHTKNYYSSDSPDEKKDQQQNLFVNPTVSIDENGNLLVDASNTTKIDDDHESDHFYYGFSTQDNFLDGMKIGRYHHLHENMFCQDDLSRNVHYKDLLVTAHCAKYFFPDVNVPSWYDKSMEIEKEHFTALCTDSESQENKNGDDFEKIHNLTTFIDPSIVDNANFPLDDNCISSCVCTFTNIEDGHFLIQPLQYNRGKSTNMVLLSACSGHGFKFTSVIGEIVADMCGDNLREDVKWLSAERVAFPKK